MPRKNINPSIDSAALLFQVAIGGDLSLIKPQYEPFINFNVTDEEGHTPLERAAFKGHFSVVQYLLKKGANPNAKTACGNTALHNAVAEGYFDIVQLLVSQHEIKINEKTKKGYAALHAAARTGDCKLIQVLLDQGANPNIQDNKGYTPLYYAIRYNLNAVVILIAGGANVNIKNYKGNTPLKFALFRGNYHTADFIEAIMDNTAIVHKDIKAVGLYYAVKFDCIQAAKELLLHNPEFIRIRDKEGYSLLDIALKNGRRELAILLLSLTSKIKENDKKYPQYIENLIHDLYTIERYTEERRNNSLMHGESESEFEFESELEEESDSETDFNESDLEDDLISEPGSQFNGTSISDSNSIIIEQALKLEKQARKKHIELIALLFFKGYGSYRLDVEQCPALAIMNSSDQAIMQGFLYRLEKYNAQRVKLTHQFFGKEKAYSELSKIEQESINVWLHLDIETKLRFYTLVMAYLKDSAFGKLPRELFEMICDYDLRNKMQALSPVMLDQYRFSNDVSIISTLTSGLSFFYIERSNHLPLQTSTHKLAKNEAS
jgi:ankyrin repeat protein